MTERLATYIWADALIRRAMIAGASAFVVQKGDAARGDVLIKIAPMDGTAKLYAPSLTMEGARVFMNLAIQGVGTDETDADAYIKRARERDQDLWVIEIEDTKARHFLTEPTQEPEPPATES